MYKKILPALLVMTALLVSSCSIASTKSGETTSLPDSSSALSTSAPDSTTQLESSDEMTTEEASMPETSEETPTTATEPEIDMEYLRSLTFDAAAMFNPFGFAVVGENKDGVLKYGMIGEDGRFVIQPEYDAFRTTNSEILFYTTDLDIGYTWLQKDGLWGFVNETCEWVLDPVYEDCTCFTSFGLAGFLQDGKWGFISTTGKVIIEPIYDAVMVDERKDYVQVKKDSLWGLIDKTGKEVLAPISSTRILTTGTYGEHGYWEYDGDNIALINGLTCMITLDGQVLYEGASFDFSTIGPNEMFYANSTTLGNGYFNMEGDLVIPLADDEFGLTFSEDGFARVVKQKDGLLYSYRYIDEAGNPLSDKVFSFAQVFSPNGLACVQIDGKCGYIDTSGAYAIKLQFDEAYSFTENGLACVKVDGKYGFIDKTGTFIIDPIYDDADVNSSGAYVEVKKDGKAGIVDTEGNLVIDFAFERISSRPLCFDEKNSPIFDAEQDGMVGLIDIHGDWILAPQYQAIVEFRSISDEGWMMLCYSDTSYIMTHKDGTFGILSLHGKIILEDAGEVDRIDIATNGYTIVKTDGKYSYIDLDC